ncbi:MAG: spermidine synthase [Phenylobacterium sp.]
MTEATIRAPRTFNLNAWLFPAAIFTSATLVFLVQPMLAKMLLPKLGGSPAVWNTSMVFFQAALLVGYAYAHLLQRLQNFKLEAAIHLGGLACASIFLPLGFASYLGDPSSAAPARWLFAALTTSVAAPFAILSATAPLLQSWYSRLRHGDAAGGNPYPLYVASNVGSMLALLAYPLVVEPLLPLGDQSRLWAAGYGVFCVLAAAIALAIFSEAGKGAVPLDATTAPEPEVSKITAKARLVWILLAALPSSLMLGTTTYISTDVAAAPLLWVVPLALYLLTFIVAFQAAPMISARAARLGQGLLVPICLASMVGRDFGWIVVLILHASAFFFSALVCHQALAARRPEPRHLTEFYLYLSLGGVLGGAATALLAPVVFNYVLEYPLVLVLAALARPMTGRATPADWAALAVAVLCVGLLVALSVTGGVMTLAVVVLLTFAAAAAILLRNQPRLFAGALAVVAAGALMSGGRSADLHTARSFFGVHRVILQHNPALGGDVHVLAHGTTAHGAQPLSPAFRCQPTAYYAPVTAIGQAFAVMAAANPSQRIGVVGLGTGGVATYDRISDSMRFFEIDPKVEAIARDRRYFTYLSGCARGSVDVVIGDARLTLAKEPTGIYDLLLLDAFTSDAIPVHLLTVEALQQYLRVLKPNGVLMMHISNRHLALEGIAAADVERLGAHALIQNYRPPKGAPGGVANPTDVMLVSRSEEALAKFRTDPRWRPARSDGASPWTDDHSDIVTALLAHAFAKPKP